MGHGLRRRCREGVLAGRIILLNYVVWGQRGSVSARLWNTDPQRRLGNFRVSLSSLEKSSSGRARRVSTKEHADEQGAAGTRLQREDRCLIGRQWYTRLTSQALSIA